MGKKFPPNNLRRLRDNADMTQEEFAAKIGMSKSGYIKVEQSTRGLKTDRIAVIARVLNISPADIVVAREDDEEDEPPVEVLEPAGREFAFKRLGGDLSAGIFKDVEAHQDDVEEMISTPPSKRFPWARQFAWKVKGDSMNEAKPKPINDGDYVVGLAYEDIQEEVQLKSGINVVVQQTRDNWQSFEETVKELNIFEDRVEFWPRSSNPRHKPIIVRRDLTADDGRKVVIRALVQYVIDYHEALF